MWISKSLLDLFSIGRQTVDELRTEISTLKATNSILERELIANKINCDWARLRVNQLEAERSKLMEKAYPGLNLPAPEILRVQNRIKDGFDLQALFEDQGDPSDSSTNKVPPFPAFS